MRTKITTIIGYNAPRSEMPSIDANNGMDRVVWIEKHTKITYRSGHWNIVSAEKVAAKLGIVDGLEIKHLN